LDIGDWVVAGWPSHAFFVADCDTVDVELKQLVGFLALDLVRVGGCVLRGDSGEPIQKTGERSMQRMQIEL
jgi:hypothetical protein